MEGYFRIETIDCIQPEKTNKQMLKGPQAHSDKVADKDYFLSGGFVRFCLYV